MNTQPPERPNNEGEHDEVLDRLEAIEDRFAGLEDELRLTGIEERLANLEGSPENEDGTVHSNIEGEGQRTLRLALAGFLNNETIVAATADLTKAFSDTIKEWSSLKAKGIRAHTEASLKSYYLGLGFSAFLLIVLSVLLWNDKINKELAAGLLGSLIGYWYGRDKAKN